MDAGADTTAIDIVDSAIVDTAIAPRPDTGAIPDTHVSPPDLGVVDACKPKTCPELGAECGTQGDGCGGVLDCGGCPMGTVCGGGGIPSVCGSPIGDAGSDCPGGCCPRSCKDQGATCGPIGDGCGGVLNCGACPGTMTCGGGGVPYQCGDTRPDAGSDACQPRTCKDVPADCGFVGDGCGGALSCGTCPVTLTCGGGGLPNQCGAPVVDAGPDACPPRACKDVPANCGYIGDGCGGILACGLCTGKATCGGGGVPNQCGVCLPKSCTDVGADCGAIADGCGGIIASCGTCTAPMTCGGGGVANHCGGPIDLDGGVPSDGGGPHCMSACCPMTCKDIGFNCGPAGDGCGGLLDCGTCPKGQTCSKSVPGKCG
jgi:hypothetical protein